MFVILNCCYFCKIIIQLIFIMPTRCVPFEEGRLQRVDKMLRGGILQSALCNCDHFLIYSAPRLSSNLSRFIDQRSLLWLQQRHLLAKRVETGREKAAGFCLSVSLSYLKGSLTCHQVLRHGADGFISPPKEVVLRIFISLKDSSLSAGFEPANL
jgi:hypothetical protein